MKKLNRLSMINRLLKSHSQETEHWSETSTSSAAQIRGNTLEAREMLGEMLDIIKHIPDVELRVALDYLVNSAGSRIIDADFAFDHLMKQSELESERASPDSSSQGGLATSTEPRTTLDRVVAEIKQSPYWAEELEIEP